jgi:magnesium-transporting ATPase (P-type)
MVYYLSDRLYLIHAALGNTHPPELPWPSIAAYFGDLSDLEVYSLAITVFYAGVVMAQVGNAFACRAETNRGIALGWTSNINLLFGVAMEVFLLLIVIYIAPIASWFDFSPLPAFFWLWLAPYALILYTLEWIRKAAVRQLQPHPELIHPNT